MAELDETDRRIVDALRRNSRLSMRALAAALHISRANAYTRVARLERDGVITGYADGERTTRLPMTVTSHPGALRLLV